MGGAVSRLWEILRSVWRSLRRAPTQRDAVGVVRELEPSHKGGDRSEGGAEDAVSELDGLNDGALRDQDSKIDGRHEATERVDVGVPHPGDTDKAAEVDGGRHGRGDPPMVEEPAGSYEVMEEPEQEGTREPEPADPEQLAADERPGKKPPRPRRPRRKPSETGGARSPGGERESAAVDGVRRQRAPRVARARIVCRKTAGRWELVVVPGPGVAVRSTDGQARRADGEFRATRFRDEAVIEDVGGGQEERLPLYADEPLLFRLGNDWQGDGRKVGGVGVGHFVAIAPSEWTRIGEVPVEDEPCVDDGFRAHYFYRGRDDHGSVDGFEEHGVSSSVIDLVGQRVFDTSDQGELFVGRPPALKAPGMAWARVGEEGVRRWGKTFRLDEGQSLEDVLCGREGWFFVRVYREDVGAEADSVQFRYLGDLHGIRLAGEPYADDNLLLPQTGGHQAVTVEITGAGESEVAVTSASSGTHELEVRGGAVLCPPDPDLKEVRCRVEGRRGGVDIVVDLPRVWWGLASAGRVPQPWRDGAQTMTREEFRQQALAGAEVWMDLPRGLRRVGVGFGDDSRIDHPARKEGARYRCVVPLAHYLDHSQIDCRLFRDVVLVGHFAESDVGLVRVKAEPPPRIADFSVAPDRVSPGDVVVARWAVEDCEGVTVSLAPGVGSVEAQGSCEIRIQHPTVVTLTLAASGMKDVVAERAIKVENPQATGDEQLVAKARAAGGWRTAKGFSETELSAVPGSDLLPVRIDQRRRTMHEVNVASLERWMSERR